MGLVQMVKNIVILSYERRFLTDRRYLGPIPSPINKSTFDLSIPISNGFSLVLVAYSE